jgi:hypothetical protein
LEKTGPQERIVLGCLLLGFSLLGMSFVATSRVDARGTVLPPDMLTGRILQVIGIAVLVGTIMLAPRYFETKRAGGC